jgi:hypothetical protein
MATKGGSGLPRHKDGPAVAAIRLPIYKASTLCSGRPQLYPGAGRLGSTGLLRGGG